MKKEQAIHLRFEYNEAIAMKRQVLEMQMQIVQFMKELNEYSTTRKQELNAKTRVRTRFREIANLIKKIQELFPENIFPEKEMPIKKKGSIILQKDKSINNLEKELADIRTKLEKLQ